MLAHINSYLKAHAAGLGAAITLLIADLNTGKAVTTTEWLAIAGAYLGVGAVVAVVPNTKADSAPPVHASGSQDDEASA